MSEQTEKQAQAISIEGNILAAIASNGKKIIDKIKASSGRKITAAVCHFFKSSAFSDALFL